MIYLYIFFSAYLTWCMTQYLTHIFFHHMIKKHNENILAIGEKHHHKFGKNLGHYDTESDPSLIWLNVDHKAILAVAFGIFLICWYFMSLKVAVPYILITLFICFLDLRIHKKVHLESGGFIVGISRRLHDIHHKTWRHNYAIFFGIPLDIIFRTFKWKQ